MKPHAVYQVTVGSGTRRYCYDANGNLTNQTIASGSGTLKYDSSTWWVANLAKRISYGGSASYSDFWYGAGRERIRQVAQKSSTTSEATSYVGGLYEKFTRTVSGTPTTEYVHYVRGGDHAVAVVKRISGALQTRYLHRDHLGSVVALTDSAGAVIERYAYDPWGKRRDPGTWATPAPGTFSFDPSYSDRGYTGHEHIDHLGLVNMNGRVYDPELGKFLSADPTTQYPESTQGWNRYSYCGNNPLSYTDPSGFSFLKIAMQIIAVVMNFIPVVGTFAAAAWYNAMLVGFASGFLASGGNLRAGLAGAVGGALFYAAGSAVQHFGLSGMTKALLHGIAGGTANAVAGGKFQDGFLGAFASAALSPEIEKAFGAAGTGGMQGKFLRVAASAAVGGVASVLGGGKFQNGAVTAAFARLFNDEVSAHKPNPETLDKRFRGLSPEEQQKIRQDFLNRYDEIYADQENYSGDALDVSETIGKGARVLSFLGKVPGWASAVTNTFNTSLEVGLSSKLDGYWAAKNSYEAWAGDATKDNWFASKQFQGFDWGPYNIASSVRLSVDFYYHVTQQTQLRPPTCAIDRSC